MFFRGKLPDLDGDDKGTDVDFDDVTPSEDLIPTKNLRVEGLRIGVASLIRAREGGREQAFIECKRKCKELYLSWTLGYRIGFLVGGIMVSGAVLLLFLRW